MHPTYTSNLITKSIVMVFTFKIYYITRVNHYLEEASKISQVSFGAILPACSVLPPQTYRVYPNNILVISQVSFGAILPACSVLPPQTYRGYPNNILVISQVSFRNILPACSVLPPQTYRVYPINILVITQVSFGDILPACSVYYLHKHTECILIIS